MRKPAWQFLSLALLSAACSLTFGDLKETAKLESNVNFQMSSDIHTLRVETFNGVLSVVEANDSNASAGKLSGESTVWASGNTEEEAEARASEFEWVYSESGNVGVISISKPAGLSGRVGGSLDRLKVPKHITVELDTSNGNLQITGDFQDFNLETSNGRITMQLPDGWRGRGKAESSNGRIAVRCDGELTCKVDMETGNGSTKILGPPLSQNAGDGSLYLRTGNGHIVVTHLFDSK
ncbi:MAG: hypothetical protein GY747_02110 [Planctomycetes bacterium]|nr:hypothetical protein [Planctomycetota bacterium]MCP4770023.1 hypothetical protein [Planctomycetota bacterium]MCP4859863.1 hypothetical protein [Planctomycetota bacterium]